MSYKDSNGKEIDDDEEHSINEDGYDEQSPDGKRKKKARTTFTGRQIFELEKQFEVKKYLSSSERSEMARLLNVTETQVSHVVPNEFIYCQSLGWREESLKIQIQIDELPSHELKNPYFHITMDTADIFIAILIREVTCEDFTVL